MHWVASDVLDVGRSGNARRMKHLTKLASVANATLVFSVSSHANTFFSWMMAKFPHASEQHRKDEFCGEFNRLVTKGCATPGN